MMDPSLRPVPDRIWASAPDITAAELCTEAKLAALNAFVLAEQPSNETAKEELVRTSSTPVQLPALNVRISVANSGLDWSGSIEGPTLLQDARLLAGQDAFHNRAAQYAQNDDYRNSPKIPLSRVSEDAGSGAFSASSQSADGLKAALPDNSAQGKASTDASLESPFEAKQFQDEPMERPPPEPPSADVVETSATEPPMVLDSMLSPPAGGPAHQPVPWLSQQQNLGHRGQGMKSLSCLEAEGIPMLPSMHGMLPSMQGVDVSSNSSNEIQLISALRQKLAEGTHLKQARPGQQISGRAQSLAASQNLGHVVNTLDRQGTAGPARAEGESAGEEDLSGATSLQADLLTFKPVVNSSVSRVPSMLDMAATLEEPVEDDEWLINFSEIELGRVIGRGAFGEVFRGMWRHTDVAVKRFYDFSESLLEDFEKEVALMRRIRHSNIVLFLGAVSESPNLCIITAFMPRGSLYSLLHTAKVQLDERQRLWMALDCARGMNFLHCCRPPIVHCDLKSPNLLVDRDFTIKVCDFGLSRQRRKTMLSARGPGAIGTAEWTAPEVLRGLPFNEKSDAYSFGVVLFELYTQTPPWPELSSVQVVGAVGWGNVSLTVPEDIDPGMQDLMRACLQRDPQKRPSFHEIICSLRSMRSSKD